MIDTRPFVLSLTLAIGLGMTLGAVLAGCSDPCPGGACDDLPEDPWTPPDDDDDDETGNYGDDDDDDDDTWGDDDTTPEIVSVRDCVSHVTYTPNGTPGSIAVAGEFNGFDAATDVMADTDSDGVWELDIELDPGEYAYKFVVDGEWEGSPPPNRYTKWYGGSENRNLRVGDCTLPLLQTESASATASGDLDVYVQVALSEDETPLDTSSVAITVGGADYSGQATVTEGGSIELHVTGLPPGKHSVRIWAADQAGRRAENEPLFIPLWVEDEAFEWLDTTMYFAFTDRFRNGDWDADPPMYDPVYGVEDLANYWGGDFQGIIDAMQMDDYFTELGVNLLWLSPVYENTDNGYGGDDGHQYSGFHGYWPTLARTPESRFGDVDADAEDRLKALIDEAHSRGIRVLLDLVLNHVHEDHEYVDSYPEWFAGGGCVCGTDNCDWDTHAIDCWFRDYLPDLDYTNHDIVMQQLDDVLWWAREYDVDAFRVDAAKHMNHVIMRSLSMRLRDEYEVGGGAPFYLVGETYVFTDGHGQIMDYVADWELDGQFDFPLVWTAREVFAGWGSFTDLENMVATGEAEYGDAVMSPFIGNHDILRYSTYLAENYDPYDDWNQPEDLMASGDATVDQWDLIHKMSMAFCFVLTQKGAPLIYYGDEIGLAGNGDPDNRRAMSFAPYLNANQDEMLGRMQALGQARQDSKALRRGDRAQIWVDDDFYVYSRDAGNGDVAIVAMNKGGSTRTESVTIPGDLGIDGQTLTNAVGSGSISISGGSASISMGSWEYAVYVP